jgi:hypothetical protein
MTVDAASPLPTARIAVKNHYFPCVFKDMVPPKRRKIKLIEANAKYRQLKQIVLYRDFAAGAYLS